MRVATVDMRKIFDSWGESTRPAQGIKKLKQSLSKENNERLKVISQRKATIESISREATERGSQASPEEKKRMEQKFRHANLEMQALEQNRKDFLSENQRKIKNKESITARSIMRRINESIQAYATEKKYHMVIESGGYTTRNLPLFLHLEDAVDISDEIIARLNREERKQNQ